MFVYYAAFALLVLVCLCVIRLRGGAQTLLRPSSANPNFVQFQKTYFSAYLPALFADWLQGPYEYKLYSYYGFEEDQIAVLYVCGFASSVAIGSWAPVAADRFGRRRLCLVFTVVYSLGCLLKLSNSYFVLIVGRVLGGVATALLFSAFESWYLHEHVEVNDFPKEWVQETFDKVDLWSGLLAIAAGLLANATAQCTNLGPVSPFMAAIPCLAVVGVLVSRNWTENRSATPVKLHKSCADGLRVIGKTPKLFLAGIVQSLFESTMYIFVFIWTPVLDKDGAPLGVIFASFMAATVVGAGAFEVARRRGISSVTLLAVAVATATVGNAACVAATHPDRPRAVVAFLGFLVVEFAVGVYFKAMTVVRAALVPGEMRGAVNAWFRVPLNLIACVILAALHDDSFRHGNRLIFVSCVALLAFGCVCAAALRSMVLRDDDDGPDGDVADQTTALVPDAVKNNKIVELR